METKPTCVMTRARRPGDYNSAMSSTDTDWRDRWRLNPAGVDAVLAAVLSVLVFVMGFGDAPAALLCTIPLVWRRRWPLIVFGFVFLGATLSNATPEYVVFSAILISAYSVGAYSTERLLSLGVLLAAAIAVLQIYGGGGAPSIPNEAAPFLILFPMWLVGNAIRNWHLRADAMEERA